MVSSFLFVERVFDFYSIFFLLYLLFSLVHLSYVLYSPGFVFIYACYAPCVCRKFSLCKQSLIIKSNKLKILYVSRPHT